MILFACVPLTAEAFARHATKWIIFFVCSFFEKQFLFYAFTRALLYIVVNSLVRPSLPPARMVYSILFRGSRQNMEVFYNWKMLNRINKTLTRTGCDWIKEGLTLWSWGNLEIDFEYFVYLNCGLTRFVVAGSLLPWVFKWINVPFLRIRKFLFYITFGFVFVVANSKNVNKNKC